MTQHVPGLRVTDPQFLHELEVGSGISREVIAKAGLYVTTDPKALAKLKIGAAAMWQSQYLPALVFPYPELNKRDPVLYAAKPRVPIELGAKDGKPGKPAKYLRTRDALYCYLPPNITPRLLDDQNIPLLITEGEKKALSACSHGLACIGIAGVHTWGKGRDKDKEPRRMGGWGDKDQHGVKRLFEPIERAAKAGKDIFIVFDSDAVENLITVRAAENDLARALTKSGATVYIVRLPSGTGGEKVGLDDFLVAHGVEVFRRRMHDAREQGPACTAEEAARHRRPEVIISTNRKVTLDMALDALRDHGGIYQRGGNLARISRELKKLKHVISASGAPRISLLPKSTLGAELSNRASICRVTGNGHAVPEHPPNWLLDCILELGEWVHMPLLTGVVEVPVIRPDGTLLTQRGYDEATGLYLEPLGKLANVPERPSNEDVRYARELLEETVADFPFRSPAHRSAWIASIFTLVARFAFDGPTPLFLFDAPTAGSGKTLLAHLAVHIATGRAPSKYQFSREDAEQRKLITTIAIEGDRAVLFDNLIGELGGGALCDALTATRWKDRILGENRGYAGPLLSIWLATGNNVRLGDDMHRRVVHVRLQPEQERPEERSGFTHPDLLRHAHEHQERLLCAVLTIFRAYQAAGRPEVPLKPWGSYESWSKAVRAPLVWAGCEDPALTRDELITSACLTDDAASRFVRGWKQLTSVIGECPSGRAQKAIFPISFDRYSTADERDPFPRLREAIEELAPGHGGPISAKSLGRLLAKYRGRVIGGLALESRTVAGETLWRVVGRDESIAPQSDHSAGFTEPVSWQQ
jgi:hypothetical protein